MEIELRKHQNNLIIVGTGIIILGFWSVAKSIMMFTIDNTSLEKIVKQVVMDSGTDSEMASNLTASDLMLIVTIITMVVTILELFVRVYIGKSAIAEGRGQKKGNLYVALAILLALMDGIILVLNVYSILNTEEASLGTAMNVANDIVTIIVDLTCLITTLVMIHSVIKLRKIAKELIV